MKTVIFQAKNQTGVHLTGKFDIFHQLNEAMQTVQDFTGKFDIFHFSMKIFLFGSNGTPFAFGYRPEYSFKLK